MTNDEQYQRYLQAHGEDLLTNWRARFYLGLQAMDRDAALAKLAAMPCSPDLPPHVKECWPAAIEAFHQQGHEERSPRVRAAIICALYWAAIYQELPEAERWEQVEARRLAAKALTQLRPRLSPRGRSMTVAPDTDGPVSAPESAA